MWLPTRGMALTRKGMGWGQSDPAAAGTKGQGTVTASQKPGSCGPWPLWESDLLKGWNKLFGSSQLSINQNEGLSALGLKLLLDATTRTVSPVTERTN